MLFAVGGEHTRTDVLEAHDTVVGVTVDWIESHAHTRYRINGQVAVVDAEGIIAATFRQTLQPIESLIHTRSHGSLVSSGASAGWDLVPPQPGSTSTRTDTITVIVLMAPMDNLQSIPLHPDDAPDCHSRAEGNGPLAILDQTHQTTRPTGSPRRSRLSARRLTATSDKAHPPAPLSGQMSIAHGARRPPYEALDITAQNPCLQHATATRYRPFLWHPATLDVGDSRPLRVIAFCSGVHGARPTASRRVRDAETFEMVM